MADWVQLSGGTFINLDRVDCLVPTENGTRIIFSGLEDDAITVSDLAEEIIVKLKVR